MQFLPFLGKQLKDNDVIAVLEDMGMEVLYDFDRLHEGQPDKYWAASKAAGFQFGFDSVQTLNVIFLHIVPTHGFAAISRQDCDIPLFATASETEIFGEKQHLQVAKGSADFLGIARDWVRLGFARHSIHYEFHGPILAMVTITQNGEHQAI